MRKILIASVVAIASLVTGLQGKAEYAGAFTEPCFISYESWMYCPNSEGMYMAGYPQDDGTYHYYQFQCTSWNCNW